MTSPARYFIPVCLYPHTKYRTSSGVTDLFENYALHSNEYLIVVADRLLVLDRLVTGRYWSVDSVVAKARREATQIQALIKRIAAKAGARSSGRVVMWDEIASTDEFSKFTSLAYDIILQDTMLAGAIEDFVERRVQRFGLGIAPDQERGYEREYLLSEVCMSVFCTEVLGFENEVWERPPPADIPDPLKILYRDRLNLVEALTGHPATRSLCYLYANPSQEAAGSLERLREESESNGVLPVAT